MKAEIKNNSTLRDRYDYSKSDLEQQIDKIKQLKEELIKIKAEKPKILVVDDEPHIANLIKASLEDDFEVIIANSGNEALHRARYERPDLITMDIMMPGMSGFEVVEELKKWDDTNKVPVIFLSAKDKLKDMYKGMLTGADDYVTKPFEPDDLVKRVKATLQTQ
jgi:DNA-binding response OmpR family regulator